MRRLIALVIIGLGIAIAIIHLRKKENRSQQKVTNVPVIRKRIPWLYDSRVVFIRLPALMITFTADVYQQQ